MYPRPAWTPSPLCLPLPNAWIDRLWDATIILCVQLSNPLLVSSIPPHFFRLRVMATSCWNAHLLSHGPAIHASLRRLYIKQKSQQRACPRFVLLRLSWLSPALFYTQLQILFSFKEYGFQKQPSQVCVPKGERYSSCLMSKSVLPNQSILTFKYRVICSRNHTENHNIGKWFLL